MSSSLPRGFERLSNPEEVKGCVWTFSHLTYPGTLHEPDEILPPFFTFRITPFW